MDSEERTCTNCAWSQKELSNRLSCRYDTPTVNATGSVWPIVLPDDWCRHHGFTRGWSGDKVEERKPSDIGLLMTDYGEAEIRPMDEENAQKILDEIRKMVEGQKLYRPVSLKIGKLEIES